MPVSPSRSRMKLQQSLLRRDGALPFLAIDVDAQLQHLHIFASFSHFFHPAFSTVLERLSESALQ